MENQLTQQIKVILETNFQPIQMELIDDSHLHQGHGGNIHGGRHYRLFIQSKAFDGLKLIQRHRAIYSALGPLLESKQIHAIQIEAKDSGE